MAPAVTSSIYVVDDAPFLTELYTVLLGASGYRVHAFNDRAEALAALKADWNKPDLLITDYRGLSMPVDQFLHQCLLVYPALRILMVTGFKRTDLRFSRAKPDRFMEKPFTPEELQREVKAILDT
jgi:DNA-binding NtrC family response regulator